MKKLIWMDAGLIIGTLATIFMGLWMFYPPSALVIVGLLVWLDLHKEERKIK